MTLGCANSTRVLNRASAENRPSQLNREHLNGKSDGMPWLVISLIQSAPFPYADVASKAALSAGIGLLVGLEREWSHKEIGVRTFAIAGLLGMITSLFDSPMVIAALTGVLVLVIFLNIHSLLKDRSLELTTSLCLIVTFVLGVLVGSGHPFTASTSAIAMMLLLAWKPELEKFAGALRPEEIRSAVLLGLLSVVIYPLLPNRTIDPWQLINPRQAWMIVLVIAAIGFGNYVLLRVYSTRGIYYAAILGGLVNSTAAVAELAGLFAGAEQMVSVAMSALLLTDVAMFARNLVILAIFAHQAALSAGIPLLVMAAASALAAWHEGDHGSTRGTIRLSSPLSLARVLRFAVLFLAIEVAGTLAQRSLGSLGFLGVSVLGGLVSSASTTATAAALFTSGKITATTAGIGAVLTSIASALVNLPLISRQARQPRLTRRLTAATAVISVAGILVLAAIEWTRRHYR
jgi:uncharacterized membrane protein (DUF4010 family)